MHKNSIALHNWLGEFRRHISRSEANGFLELGKAEWRCLRCTSKSSYGRCVNGGGHQMALQLKKRERSKRPSPATLTYLDVLAVAGIAESKFNGPTEAEILEAKREKLALWPFIGDTKAVRVGARP